MQTEINFSKLKVGYHEERRAYPELFKNEINSNDAQFITDKLTRHFKLGKITVSVFGYSTSTAYRLRNKIRLSSKYGLNFGTVCHEVNHFLCWKEQSKKGIDRIRHGTKKWNRNLQRLFRYCIKKNFWIDEIQKRSEPKPVKPEPTKDEIKLKEIARLEKKIKRYNSKLRMYYNKVKKANRRLKYLNK